MKPILIVEDEDIMRESLRDWLIDGGYAVETAKDGDEALDNVAERDFGIMILDLRLPGKNGIEVLRQAKAKRPHVKGIIITAYPSVQTAVEAMKEGIVDYLPKPFDLNKLERLVRDTLGPLQVEIKAPVKEIAPAPAPGTPEVETKGEVIAVAPGDEAAHIEKGKAHFAAREFEDAVREFTSVLAVMPESIESRVWLKKTVSAAAAPKVEDATGQAPRTKECLWMRMGMVAQRTCSNDYNCVTCEFDQMMQEKMAAGDAPEVEAALTKLKAQPGAARLCRYALKGDVSYRLCSRVFHCATCEFGQDMEEAFQQKLAKLSVRREAMRKREQTKAKA